MTLTSRLLGDEEQWPLPWPCDNAVDQNVNSNEFHLLRTQNWKGVAVQ